MVRTRCGVLMCCGWLTRRGPGLLLRWLQIFGTTTAHLVEFGERLEAIRGDDAVAAAVTSEDALKAEPAASELLPRLQRLL